MSFTHARGVLEDACVATVLVSKASLKRTLISWLLVPFGIVVMLLFCFGIDTIIGISSVSFPASVACMIILFAALMLCDFILGDRKTRELVAVIEVPAGFSLRWINVFFCPSFVLLPLSPAIDGTEIAKIIGVFLIGYVVVTSFTAFLVRGLQLLFKTSKRAMTERAEELWQNDDSIPLNQLAEPSRSSTAAPSLNASTQEITPATLAEIQAPVRAQDPAQVTGTGGPPETGSPPPSATTTLLRQNPIPITRAQKWAAFATAYLDIFTYAVISVFAGIPVYYTTGYAMPLQLCVNILAYFAALSLPTKWKKFLHPVMVSSLLTVLSIWVFALARRDSLHDALHAYQTKIKYTQLVQGKKDLAYPGAGDIFSSVLDASIVALALPMFQYRHELKKSFFPILLPNISLAIASLFGYPPFCSALGIAPTRSLSFASRSLTLALATPATVNLGGDLSLVAVLCITSGMLGVLIGPTLLRYLRIPEDDYITRGVTLGANSSAIATAMLLTSDPRAAAFSSLSMSLFGTVTVAFTSVPPLVKIITSLAQASSS